LSLPHHFSTWIDSLNQTESFNGQTLTPFNPLSWRWIMFRRSYPKARMMTNSGWPFGQCTWPLLPSKNLDCATSSPTSPLYVPHLKAPARFISPHACYIFLRTLAPPSDACLGF
jgi:hypothetical protein